MTRYFYIDQFFQTASKNPATPNAFNTATNSASLSSGFPAIGGMGGAYSGSF
ncbi:hypothetical protein [Neisseria dumasiana]|uniref:hypothetical protein n=1 Tax=Neisseria dumasiana TaxID=1931275 RepID=UPI00314545E6